MAINSMTNSIMDQIEMIRKSWPEETIAKRVKLKPWRRKIKK